MDDVFSGDDSAVRSERSGPNRPVSQELDIFWVCATNCDGKNALAVVGPQNAERGAAQAQRPFEHRVEHRREVAGRRIDDLQDFGSRSLPLKRLVTLSPAL